MVKKDINEDFITFIEDMKIDKDLKSFLKDCLDLEFDKTEDGKNYQFKDYDKRVEKYVR